MATVVINADRCKGCELCIHFCPKNQLKLSEEFNSKGQHPCEVLDQGECTGCAMCAVMCPDIAIQVYR